MSIWGKILGGAAGFALGGPLGALIGAAAGHAVDKLAETASTTWWTDDSQAEASEVEVSDNTNKIAFTIGVIVLGAKMAKVDGAVSNEEIAAFKQVFRVPPEEAQNVARIFNLARRDHRGFEPYARQIAAMFQDRRAVLEELLQCLFHIAKADGQIQPVELDYLRQVAHIFGFSEAEFARICETELGPEKSDPYHILGADRASDDATIKAAYRRLLLENHPDRLIAQGMPQEFVAIATEKMATINAAYDRIRRERGLN
jgi:DnaJ like chaperone protein